MGLPLLFLGLGILLAFVGFFTLADSYRADNPFAMVGSGIFLIVGIVMAAISLIALFGGIHVAQG